ncbi:MAG TPA: DUF4129 domain-containing protein, partial [Chloroflexia bacterium]|nr:DUF4129 domain-containing protein [Chloroflexia bacterium]
SLFHAVVLSKVGLAGAPSPLILAGLQLGAWWFVRYLLDGTRLALPLVQVLAGTAGIAAAILVQAATNSPANGGYSLGWLLTLVYALLVSLIPWFLGGYRASERPDFNGAYAGFRIGLILIGFAAIMATIIGPEVVAAAWVELGGVLLWFFVWALAGLAVGNRQMVREEYGGIKMGGWGSVLTLSIGAILIVGLIGGAANAGGLLGGVFALVTWALVLLGAVLYGIAFVISMVFYYIFMFLAAISSALGIGGGEQQQPQEASDGPAFASEFLERIRREWELTLLEVPPEVLSFITWAGVLLGAVIAILVVSSKLRRTARIRQREVAEERERIGSWAMLAQQIKEWFLKLIGRKTKGAEGVKGSLEDDLAALASHAEWSGTLSVRQIYARMQAAAGKIGYPRAVQQTPIEYLSVLSNAMPDLRTEFRDITAAYLEARYGPAPASDPAVQAATRAWKRAEAAMRSGVR